MYSVLVVSVLFWLCIITCKSQITTRSEKGKTGSLADQAIYYEFKSELKFYRGMVCLFSHKHVALID